jgi:beta-glucosidase
MPQFPRDFLWGTATASYQIEGGVTEEGRGASIWDSFCAIPGRIFNSQNGDVACDHYHRYQEDVGLMKELGLKAYRFSIAWPRVFPEGKGRPNRAGVDFYNRLIDELVRNEVDPMATLYHWDLPQALQDNGGWANRDTMDRFVDYADFSFRSFGDRVKKWVTHNEPWVAAYAGNFLGRHAPGLKDLSLAVQVSHHLILSHARVVERYKSVKDPKGEIGISLNLYPTYPATNAEGDREAAALVDEYHNRWFLDPILKGRYPEGLLRLFRQKLGSPIVMPGDMDSIAANPCDFVGINYYFRKVIRKSENHPILGFEEVKPETSRYTEMNWEIFPEGLYVLLMDIKDRYNNPRIYITENGAAFKDEMREGDLVRDPDRIDYLKGHIEQVHRAMRDGVRVLGYYVWSFMDNFEWAFGYSKRFGLFRVEYGTQKRTWKQSARWYKDVIVHGGF